MNFFEQELRKIVGANCPDATYVGRSAYVRLSEQNRAKIQFIAGVISNQYDRLLVTILNRDEGVVDKLQLRFDDLLGKKQAPNHNFRDGVDPHIWENSGKAQWYVYHPDGQDYQKLAGALKNYLDVFREQKQERTHQWQQSM